MKNKTYLLIIKIVISCFLIFLLYHNVSRTQFWDAVSERHLILLLPILVLLGFNTMLSTIKWRILLKADGVELPFGRLFVSYMIGSFFNIFLPSNIGGDVYRIYSIGHGAKLSKSFSSVFADRFSGLVALVMIGLFFSVVEFETIADQRLIVAPMLVFLFILVAMWVVLLPPVINRLLGLSVFTRIGSLRSFILQCVESFEKYKGRPVLLAKIMGISFAFQGIVVLCIVLLSITIGIKLPLMSFLVFVPLVSIMEALPISIYGLGLRDAGYVFFFSQMGLRDPQVHALALSLLYVAVTFLYASLGGVMFLYRLYFLRPTEDTRIQVSSPACAAGDVLSGESKPITIGIMLRHIEERGGINVYSRNIMEHILRVDRKNRYVLFTPIPILTRKQRLYPNVKEVITESAKIPMKKLAWDQYTILKYLDKHKVDVVFNPKLAVPLFARCKTVLTMHGLEQFAADDLFLWWDRLYFNIAMRLYCKRADAVLVMSETGKKDIQKYLSIPADKVHVIPESFNERCSVISDKAELARVKDELCLPDRFILFVGGVTPLKNIPVLLRALRILKDQGFSHKLVLAGFKRWRFAEDMALVEELNLGDDVIELGFVNDNDISAIYNLAECFVLPSFYEGFGLPILEAQACGCPVVVSDRGAMPEVAGEGALSFDPTSPEQLAERIHQIFANQSFRKALAQRGLENAGKYSWEKTARRTIQLFESLAAAK